jgi:TPR repeat protein
MRAPGHLAPFFLVALAACSAAPAPSKPPAKSPAKAAVDRCSGVAACEAACLGARPDRCEDAAAEMRSHALEASAPRLAVVLGRACDAGKATACKRLADLVRDSPAIPRDDARVKALSSRACDLGEGVACLNLVDTGSIGRSEDPPPEARARLDRTEALLTARCDAHDGASCMVLSALALMLQPDRVKSRTLAARAGEDLESSCLGGAAADCPRGAVTLDGIGGGAFRIDRLLKHGCDLGDAESCTLLANSSTTATRAEKTALFDKGCAGGREDACFLLAKLQDEAAPDDPSSGMAALQQAARLARARCNLAEPGACEALATVLVLPNVQDADAAKIAADLEEVCDRRAAVTCNALAEALSKGPEARRDPARIARLKKKACDFGYPFACADPMAAIRGKN